MHGWSINNTPQAYLPHADHSADVSKMVLRMTLKQRGHYSHYSCNLIMAEKKPAGLYANIHAKQARIKNGSGEQMRKPGDPKAPTNKDFRDSAKTAKKK